MLAAERPELRKDVEPAVMKSNSDAGELRETNAEVIPVRDDDVAQLLEIGAKRVQLGRQRGSGELSVRRHASKVRRASRRRHAAGVDGGWRKEYTERAAASRTRREYDADH